MQVQGSVGAQVQTDGNQPFLRQGRLAELITGDAVGRYYELARRGQLFMSAMQAGASLGTALTASAVTLTLWNPLGSNVNLSVLHCGVTFTAVQATTALEGYAVVYAVSPGLSTGANPTATTPAKITSALIAAGSGTFGAVGVIGQVYTAATLGATAPLIARVHPSNSALLSTTATAGVTTSEDNVDGAIVLAPGTGVTLQGIGTTANSGIVSLTWAEIPN